MAEVKQMSYNVEFQKDFIEEKLRNAKFSTIDLEMCNGDILHVSPVSYIDTSSIKDIEYLLVHVVPFHQRRNVCFTY